MKGGMTVANPKQNTKKVKCSTKFYIENGKMYPAKDGYAEIPIKGNQEDKGKPPKKPETEPETNEENPKEKESEGK